MARLDFFDDPADFLAAAEPTLAADPVLGTVIAGVTTRMVRDRAAGIEFAAPFRPWWLVVRDELGAVAGLAMRTAPFAPYPLFLLPMPDDAAAALAAALHARGEALGGLNGARPAVDLAARSWTRLTGEPVEIVEHTRLFELGELVPPPSPPGRLRRAVPDDLELARDWFARFWVEADEQAGRAPGDLLREHVDDPVQMRRRIDDGMLWFWEDASGERVQLTGASPPSYGVARIGPVYTPGEHRGRGYASAAVAAVSQGFRAGGTRVCLFTDQANPTSNSIYQRLGYRPVVDMAMLIAGTAAVS
jgi:GNAT superfamily N-acetyltransferase